MPIPSLFRYFLLVGSALLGLLLFANYMLAPEPAPVAVVAAPQPLQVQHDPRASVIERWRDDETARKAAERGEPPVSVAAAPEPVMPAAEPTQPDASQTVAAAALKTTPADVGTRRAEQIRAAKARKIRAARARNKAQREEQTASRQQDQFYSNQPQSAYAAAPTFGPFR